MRSKKVETRIDAALDPGERQTQALSIGSLEAILAVAATGSMSAAAQRLRCSQSSVSQLVSYAELSMGCALFDRSRRPFRTTREGGELSRQAARILHDLRALPQRVAALSDRPTLRIAMIDSFADTLGPDLIRFAAQSVGDLFVTQGQTPALALDLLERRVDLIVSADTLDEYDGLSRISLLKESLVLLMPQLGGRAARARSVVDLAGELPFIRYNIRSSIGVMVERYLRVARVPAARRIEVDNAVMMCTLIASGVGWGITTPLCVLQGLGRFDGVAVRKLSAPVPLREITIVTREGEWEEVAAKLAAESRRLWGEKFFPQLMGAVPELAAEVSLSAQARGWNQGLVARIGLEAVATHASARVPDQTPSIMCKNSG